MSDGPAGVRGAGADLEAALLPCATLLAASWSQAVMAEAGKILAGEARRQGVHVVLGPTINLHRSVLGGRLFEMFSEDPLLTGRLASAYVASLQQHGVGACIKHFVANECETDRTTMSSDVDEATLREVYLLPFEIAVADADPWTIMAAYNAVNGEPATEASSLLTSILRDEWGWNGVVISDWGATKSAVAALDAGLDLIMPGPEPWADHLADAARTGELSSTAIATHVDRLRILADRVAAHSPGPDAHTGDQLDVSAPDSPALRARLRRLAATGMTVLTNRSDTLPLALDTQVAVIGRHGLDTLAMGGGSAEVQAPHTVSIADGLQAAAPAWVVVCDGVAVRQQAEPADPGILTDPVSDRSGVRRTVLDANGDVLVDEYVADSAAIMYVPEGTTLRFSARVGLTGAVEIGVIGVGDWNLHADDQQCEFSLRSSGRSFGEETVVPPTATAALEFAGPTVVTAEADISDVFGPDAVAYGTWGLVARPQPTPDEELLAAAVDAASVCDVAVVVVGLTDEQETETIDRTTIALPGAQDDMVRAVATVAKRTVVLVNAATPVLMPWIDEVDAVLWIGLPGQEAGSAVAAALFGEIEPAGRLVTTFPAADGAAPAWSVTPEDGRLVYAEGPFLGYRGHASGFAPPPAFWFGHGLGYGVWEYLDARVSGGGVGPIVEVGVTNQGRRTSREVVQVYLRPAAPEEPVRLVGWAETTVDPGASATVTVSTDARMWRRWDTDTGRWRHQAGGAHLLIARGLGDIRLEVPLFPVDQDPAADSAVR